jgi:hypothetical protein
VLFLTDAPGPSGNFEVKGNNILDKTAEGCQFGFREDSSRNPLDGFVG